MFIYFHLCLCLFFITLLPVCDADPDLHHTNKAHIMSVVFRRLSSAIITTTSLLKAADQKRSGRDWNELSCFAGGSGLCCQMLRHSNPGSGCGRTLMFLRMVNELAGCTRGACFCCRGRDVAGVDGYESLLIA